MSKARCRRSPERLLIIANHESFLDGLLLGLYLPMNPVFVVHHGGLWEPLVPAHPVAGGLPGGGSHQPDGDEEGGAPARIGPTGGDLSEGRITTTGSLMKTYDARPSSPPRTGASILPIRPRRGRTWFSRVSGKAPEAPLPAHPPRHPAADPHRHARGAERPRAPPQGRRGDAPGDAEMIFASRPRQTLFEALLDTAAIHGRGRCLVEDLKQEEYSYGDLLKMSLALGRLVARQTVEGEKVGIPANLAPTLALVVGLPAFGRTPAMLNYTAGVDGMQAACTAAEVVTVLTSRAFVEQAGLATSLPRSRACASSTSRTCAPR